MADEMLGDDTEIQTIEGPQGTWVEIRTASSEEDARLIQGFLEAAGIPCQIESLEFHMTPVNFGKLGEIRVYVDSQNEEEANRLLSDRQREYEALSDDESVVTDDGAASIADDAQTQTETEE